MIYPVYGPIAAAPSLHMQLQHIARSPAARLGISYQIVTHNYCRAPGQHVAGVGFQRGHSLSHVEVAQLAATRSLRLPIGPELCLGEEIFLYNMLSGGIDGQSLPMSICVARERYTHYGPLGMLTDCLA